MVAKILNYFSCFMMVLFSGYRIYKIFDVTTDEEPLYYILTVYLVGFSILLTAAELRVTSVIMYFELMRGRGGKGIFIILVGLLVFNDKVKIDLAVSNVLLLIGIYNIVVACMRPDFSKKRMLLEEPVYSDEER